MAAQSMRTLSSDPRKPLAKGVEQCDLPMPDAVTNATPAFASRTRWKDASSGSRPFSVTPRPWTRCQSHDQRLRQPVVNGSPRGASDGPNVHETGLTDSGEQV